MAAHAEIDADIILQHSGFIRSLARGLIRDESLVDDVVQETLITALEKGPRKREALTAWLRTVTRNVAYKSYRGTARRKAREEEAAQPERLTATVDVVARGEALESLTGAVMELPEGAREVIFLRYYEGLSHAEIAERLDVAPGAVRMRVHRAQKLLQDRLDRSSGGDRLAWMSGLAGLVGIPLTELRSVAAAETVAAPVASSTMVLAFTAMLCLGLGAFVLFGVKPGGSDPDADLGLARLAAIEPLAEADAALSTATDDDREREAIGYGTLGRDLDPEPASTVAVDADPPYPPGNLQGRVVDHNGDPVSGARIFAAWGRSGMELRVSANEHGRFGMQVPKVTLDEAVDFTYSILVGATSDTSSPSRVLAFPYEGIDPHSDGDKLLIQMRGPGAALRGIVIGPDGRPFAGADIELGERLRLGVGFLGQQRAEAQNPLSPRLACVVDRASGSMFQGHRSMRGTLGTPVVDANGKRGRLLPASTRQSESDGTFRFGGLEPSLHRIRITAKGCAPYTGYVDATLRSKAPQVFRMERGAVVHGTVRPDDGLPPSGTLVHAIMQDPFEVKTVKMNAAGEYSVRGLRAGPIRIVAEERKVRGGHTPTRIASAEFTLSVGQVERVDLDIHAPQTTPVRVIVEDQGTRRPMPDMRIEVRAIHNPLLMIATVTTDEEGRALVPIETVVPCDWALTQSIVRKKSFNAKGIEVDTPIQFFDAPTSASTEEVVIRLSPADLRPANVLIEPVVPGFGPLGLNDGVQLVRTRSPHTFTGWPTDTPGVLAFHGIPPGHYRILYPHHGLGWISPFTVEIKAPSAGATVNLGIVKLPALGKLELRPSTDDPDAPTWHDLSVRAIVDDRGRTTEISVFAGRVEIPTTMSIAPGRYRISRSSGAGASTSEEITVVAGQHVTRLWP